MGRVVHFEIHADDPARAVAFYTTVFGWTVQEMPGMAYWLLATGPDDQDGINGAVLPRQGARPEIGAPIVGATMTISVEDLDATLATAQANGAGIALPTMPVPGVGNLAYIHDTEANVVGVLQPEPRA
jgi:predicted enzyme related to lactoylglutathione lyase